MSFLFVCHKCFESRKKLQGVKLIRDEEGSLLATKLTKNDIIVKGYKDPGNYCLSQDVVQAMGRLSNDREMKVSWPRSCCALRLDFPRKVLG